MARWIRLTLPLFVAFASIPAKAESVTVEGVFSSGGPRQLLEGESESITADLGMAFSRIDSVLLQFTFDGDLLAEGEELYVGIDSFCCFIIRHFFPTPRSDRSIFLSSGNNNARHFLDGVVRIDATMMTGSVFLEQVVVSVEGVLKRPSHLIPIEPDNFAPGATVMDFENLPGTALPVVPNLQFARTSGGEMRWFAGKVQVGGPLFGEAYMINLATTTRYADLAIEFETPVEAVGAWVKKVPNFRDESPQSLTVVAVDPYLNTIQRRRVFLPEVDGEPRFVGFSSEDGIVRFEWLGNDSGWFGVDEITFGAFAPLPRPVEIDIRPENSSNRVQPESKGMIAVAILGADEFEVADVDRETVAFGPDGARPTHAAGGHREDVNGDGLIDLVSHYHTQETSLASGDTEACVTGEMLDGIPFIGCDSVEVLTPRGMRATP